MVQHAVQQNTNLKRQLNNFQDLSAYAENAHAVLNSTLFVVFIYVLPISQRKSMSENQDRQFQS